ncbi:hypothetical protein [Neobacillus dielmonensis]|uniref:hypothetical protein n=1 Tax=Neobacillus dielmonensis TaxID=1347369 RepID=UPI0005A8A8DE|nr:hypothetical protein [Neobacillus dielmonensis]
MYELAQVEHGENIDEILNAGEITIVIDPVVVDHLDGDIVIDHNKNYGFILKNNFEVLTFGMNLIKAN